MQAYGVGAVGQGESSPDGYGRCGFHGAGLDLFVTEVVSWLLCVLTGGIGFVIGLPAYRRRGWIDSKVAIGGAPVRYRCSIGEWASFNIVQLLLIFCTFGLAFPWAIARRLSFTADHTTTALGRRMRFTGSGGQVLGYFLLAVVCIPVTFGLAIPWCWSLWRRWLAENTQVEDPSAPGGWARLRFDATALSLVLPILLSNFLTLVTLGLYLPWAVVNFERWAWESTRDERHPPLAVPLGPRTPGQWIGAVMLGSGAVFASVVIFSLFSAALHHAPSSSTSAPAAAASTWNVPPNVAPAAPSYAPPPPTPTYAPPPQPAPPQPSVFVDGSRLQPTSVMASSIFSNRRERHPAEHAIDDDPRTAWNDHVPGAGVGSWLEMRFDGPQNIRRIRMTPGWDHVTRRGQDLFTANSHFRRVRFVFDGGVSRTADVAYDQRVLVVDIGGVTSSSLRVVADDVWDGTAYHDLCIGDIAVEGTRAGYGQPAGGCTYRMSAASSFHLRAVDTTARGGARTLPGGVNVEVLSAGSSTRSHGRSRSYFVRVLEGEGAGATGYVFIHPDALSGGSCPR